MSLRPEVLDRLLLFYPHHRPRLFYRCDELILSSLDKWRVVLLSSFDAGMTEKQRDLIQGNSSQKILHGKSVSQHVGNAAFLCFVGVPDVGDFEKFPESSLPNA